jgi:hypothetical protein
MFRISPKDLRVFAGVLNNTMESSEETKVVQEVTKIFVHEEFVYNSSIHDIALLKVGVNFMYEKDILYISLGMKHSCHEM